MYKKALYKKAYRMLEKSTPLKFDCGLICNRKCCSGDNNAGMWLFSGEELVLDNYDKFLTIRNEKVLNTDVLFAVCNGSCDRKLRPLSCRIFPLVPYLDGDDRLTIIEDPRARYICPLLMDSFEIKVEKMFKQKVTKVFQLLIRDNDIRNHIRMLSVVLDDFMKFLC